MSLRTILIAYVIGGITLPPLLIFAILYLIYATLPVFDDELDDDLSEFEDKEYRSLSLTQLEEDSTSGVKAYKVGWITVTREYHHFVQNDKEKGIDQKDGSTKSAYTVLYRLVKNSKKDGKDGTKDDPSGNTTGAPSSPSVPKTVTKKKNRYFAVLRHGNLFLYKNEDQKDVQHVIVLSNNIVTIWPRNVKDGELFTKKTAICLLKRQGRRKSDLPQKSSAASLDEKESLESTYDILDKGVIPPGNMGFFIYCDTNYEKEDWYFALIKATKRESFTPTGSELDQMEPSVYANALHFKTADMISLIQTLHSSEGQLQTRWLNAAVGRIFLALQYTDFFERVMEAKILKKLAKINRPGFLEEFQVKKIDIGNAAPCISFPKLESLNPDGSMRVSFKFSYTGKLSLQVATKANINLGSAFKTREVGLLLAVTLNNIEGPLAIVVKPPPSSRLWWTFAEMPHMDMTIEPVVSQHQITYGMITKVIENKFRDSIKESLVEPYWDDISFFDTSDEFYRGGIWDTKKRPTQDVHRADTETAMELEAQNLERTEEDEEVVEEDTMAAGELALDDVASAQSSLRSRGTEQLKTKSSFSSISNFTKRKTDASIGTSDDQYLADGSYVSRDQVASQETTGSDADTSEGTSRSSTMHFLSEEGVAGKKALSTGLKKIGKWYNEKNKNGNAQPKREKPEMISRRRAPSNTTEKQVPPSHAGNIDSDIHKSAPQAHSFPAEFMHDLDSHRPDLDINTKSLPPSRVPEMKSPYTSREGSVSTMKSPVLLDHGSDTIPSHPTTNILRRKPVEEDTAIAKLGSATSVPADTPSDTPSDSSTAVSSTATQPPIPLRKAPPALPPRAATTETEESKRHLPPPLPLRELATSNDTVTSVVDSSESSPSPPTADPLADSDTEPVIQHWT